MQMNSEQAPDEDLRQVWADMDPAERLLLLLAAGEQPPEWMRQEVRQMYPEPACPDPDSIP